ncbi:ferritin-like protein [Terasakiella sp. SH-1]|uniref:ferritin-like domain-containing protein n=1 Tax=Terasakiella sp. SH-1 TaxID=2560057 RepID=UPI00107484E2|nr:ferritin-like protein [Terasakiella sp. SH-1]
MLKHISTLVSSAKAATSVEDIQELLQDAITLELATLPTYYTGVFSLKPSAAPYARALIQSVAHEEMLHMTLACNLLISIGGKPEIKKMGETLKFPTKLPAGVIPDLVVSLKSATKEHVQEVFMGIERPDTTATLPGEVPEKMLLVVEPTYDSIGDFYHAILAKLDELSKSGNNPFVEDSEKLQLNVSDLFPNAIETGQKPTEAPEKYQTGYVTDLTSAAIMVDTILDQGEGAKINTDPVCPYGGMNHSFAHYFKFGEIYHGKKLIKDDTAVSGWSYTGEDIPVTDDDIYNFKPNAALSDYQEGTAVYQAAQEFYLAYMRLIDSLDKTFNGDPSMISSAIGVMFELKLVAEKVVQFEIESNGQTYTAAPPFQLEKNEAS